MGAIQCVFIRPFQGRGVVRFGLRRGEPLRLYITPLRGFRLHLGNKSKSLRRFILYYARFALSLPNGFKMF